MPEGENIEIAHFLAEVGEKEKEEHLSSPKHELVEAILLAVMALATAWSGYQAARWDAHSTLYYEEANTDQETATQLSTLGGHYLLFDDMTFHAWLQVTAEGKTGLATFYVRRFSPPYRIAFDAWLKTDPMHNPKAPSGPAYMPQYHNPQLAQATILNNQALARFEQGTSAIETAEEYVLATVLLATILFVVALRHRFTIARVRTALLALALVLVLYGVVTLATYPIA
jgi:hypothetical protein